MSDGAAAVLLAHRSTADALGLPVLGLLKSYAVVGVPPDVMGIGPAFAIPVALERAGGNVPRTLCGHGMPNECEIGIFVTRFMYDLDIVALRIV